MSAPDIVPLIEANDISVFGSKAVGLGDAIRDGLPVPPGFALAGPVVEAVAAEDAATIEQRAAAVRDLPTPLAVRSSAVDEDGKDASFAGQHLTLLNVSSDRRRAGRAPRDLVVGQLRLRDHLPPARRAFHPPERRRGGAVVARPRRRRRDVHREPGDRCRRARDRSGWGLGEAVVAGLVIPDTYRVARDGTVLERTPGLKRIAVRTRPDGGTYEEEIAAVRAEALSLDDDHLAQLHRLAQHCEEVLRQRARHRVGGRRRHDLPAPVPRGHHLHAKSAAIDPTRPVAENDPADVLPAVPFFAGLSDDDVERIASLFKARRFAAGDAVIREGSGGAAFYMIDSGEAQVTIRGDEVATLGPGDHFGEIALIDDGERLATVTATTELVCHGLTYWEFRPLVQENGAIGWKLLQSMAEMLRNAEQPSAPAERPSPLGREVGLPVGVDRPRAGDDPEAGLRFAGRVREPQPRLGEQAVLLARVARPARRHDVVPGVRAAAGARHHVVDVLGRPVAVLAAMAVASEDRAAGERDPVAVRHPHEVVEPDHRRHRGAGRARSAGPRRCGRRSPPSPSARARRPGASARRRAARSWR